MLETARLYSLSSCTVVVNIFALNVSVKRANMQFDYSCPFLLTRCLSDNRICLRRVLVLKINSFQSICIIIITISIIIITSI